LLSAVRIRLPRLCLGFAVEPKVEEPGEHGIAVGQGDETVADVAGGGQAVLAAQAARAPAVVGDRHDRGQPPRIHRPDPRGAVREQLRLQPAQHDRQSGPAAEGDHLEVAP